MSLSVRQTYDAELKLRGYQSDPAQLRAIDALERCAMEWKAFKEKRSNFVKKSIETPGRGLFEPEKVLKNSKIKRPLIHCQRRFFGRFAQRWVRMADARNVLGTGLELHGYYSL